MERKPTRTDSRNLARDAKNDVIPIASSAAVSSTPRLTEKDIVGIKYFDQLLPLFQRLHDEGCARDVAGNRVLHYDQYCLMVLVF
jgi:hypothetical protein